MFINRFIFLICPDLFKIRKFHAKLMAGGRFPTMQNKLLIVILYWLMECARNCMSGHEIGWSSNQILISEVIVKLTVAL
jgi:hypothetical protein